MNISAHRLNNNNKKHNIGILMPGYQTEGRVCQKTDIMLNPTTDGNAQKNRSERITKK